MAAVIASSMAGVFAPGARAGSSVGDFEIDGNLVDDPAGGAIDWSTPPPNLTPIPDLSGRADDSFTEGSKELEPGNWTCTDSSVPGKDDITGGQIAFRVLDGKQFVYTNYTRAGVNGDAHIDYEFFQSAAPNPACPSLPQRTDGDILISFDTKNGGASINVRAFEWAFDPGSTTLGTFNPLDTGEQGVTFDGAVNIPNSIPGHKAGDFGEAALNLTDTIGDITCGQFAGAYMKTRTSTSINAALADRTSTRPISPGNCPESSLLKKVSIDDGATYHDQVAAEPGDEVTYQLTYTNTGAAPATDVEVSDILEPNQSFVVGSCSPACEVNGSTLTWSFPSVEPDDPQVMTFRATLADSFPAGSTDVPNAGSVDTAEEPPKDSNTTIVTVAAAPDLSSEKSVTPGTQEVGQSVTYTVTVKNEGNAPGTTTVSDDYDQAHVDPMAIDGGGQDDGDMIVWSDVEVPAHDEVSFTYSASVIGTYSGPSGTCSAGQYPVLNSVTITGGTGAGAQLCVVAEPEFRLEKTADQAAANIGDRVGYEVKVLNDGPADGTTTVVDSYDNDHLTISNVSNGGEVDATEGTITWTGISVPAEGSVILTYDATVGGVYDGPPGICGVGQYPVVNEVAITGEASDSYTLCVNAVASITADKTVNPTVAQVGDEVVYEILVENTGHAAGSTDVVDHYDKDHLAIGAVSHGGTVDAVAGTITWTDLTVAGDDALTLTYSTTVKGTFSGGPGSCETDQYPVVNSVTLSNGTGDSETLCVNAEAVLGSEKTVDPRTAQVGDVVVYTVVVENTGDAAGTTEVVDSYDKDHLLISDVSHGGTVDPEAGTITWSNLTLAGMSRTTLTYSATVDGTFPTSPDAGCEVGHPVVNNVTLTGGTGDSETLCVDAKPDLSSDKTVSPGSAEIGDTVGYAILVENNGDADGVTTVVDTYDGDHLDISEVSHEGAVDTVEHTITWTDIEVPAMDSVLLTYKATVKGPFDGVEPGGTPCSPTQFPVLNSVTITGGTGDSNTLCVNAPPVLTINKTACPTTAVPGGTLTYTIDFGNIGLTTATGVVLTDTVPTGTALTDSGGGSVEGSTITWTIGSLAPSEAGSRTVKVLVEAGNGSELSNTATISADNAESASTGPVVTPVSNAGSVTHGSAYGAHVVASGVSLVDQVPSASSAAPPSPAAGADELTSVGLPGVVDLGLLRQTSTSAVDTEARSTATSTVAEVDVLNGFITADVVKGVSQSVATATSSSYNFTGSTFTNLRVNGQSMANVAPNTNVVLTLLGIPLASAVLREQTGSSTFSDGMFSASGTTNMIHVTILNTLAGLPVGSEIIVAHAESDATYTSGLACGTTPATVSGEAFTAFVGGSLVDSPVLGVKQGDAVLPPLGGSASNQVADVDLGGVAEATAGNSTTSGSLTPSPESRARSIVTGASVLGGLVTADVLDVAAASSTSGTPTTTFATTFTNVEVAGIPVLLPVTPNTTVSVPLDGGGILLVILNEQSISGNAKDTEGTVNAVHAYVLRGGLVELEVIVSSAHSDAHLP
ncbi:MAG: choice-of-anchor P family protein [Actinomycetota bacterium]